jgi:hypothetical protein
VIIEEMLCGVPESRRAAVTIEPDRAAAIRRGVASLLPGDVLLITGRGHESTQQFGDRAVPLDDRVVARLALAGRSPATEQTGAASVAVVIPAHDAAGTLAEAINSALGQIRPPDEVIVVDDGSRDDTAEIARGFGKQVALLQQPRLGPSAARNAGVARARSRFVAFLDADDTWHPAKLLVQLPVIALSDAVVCATDWTRDEPRLSEDAPIAVSNVFSDDLVILNRFQTSTVVVSREAFGRSGGFSSALDGAEDWDLWMRLSRLGRIVKLDAPFVRYRDHAAGYSKDLRRHHDAALMVIERELAASPSASSRELRAWHHLRFAVAFARLGDRDRVAQCFARLWSERPLLASVPAIVRLLAPFLARRTLRRARLPSKAYQKETPATAPTRPARAVSPLAWLVGSAAARWWGAGRSGSGPRAEPPHVLRAGDECIRRRDSTA